MHGKLATVSAAGQIIIWDTETGVQHHRLALSDNSPCYSIDWCKTAPDGEVRRRRRRRSSSS
eukprot:719130-Prymnesium_polylepis.1